MANRLLTIEEFAADFDRMVKESGIDPRVFFLAMAYAAASAQDEDEQRRVRVVLGLEDK